MIGSLWTGVLGLSSQQKALDNESNNVANVNTVGYKSSRMNFEDQVYQAGIGKGSAVGGTEKSFVQGAVKETGNEYDLALQGDGFFMLKSADGNDEFFTRAGNFTTNVEGYLTDASGNRVQGWVATPIGFGTSKYDKFTTDFDSLIHDQSYEDKNADMVGSITVKRTSFDTTATQDQVNEANKAMSQYMTAANGTIIQLPESNAGEITGKVFSYDINFGNLNVNTTTGLPETVNINFTATTDKANDVRNGLINYIETGDAGEPIKLVDDQGVEAYLKDLISISDLVDGEFTISPIRPPVTEEEGKQEIINITTAATDTGTTTTPLNTWENMKTKIEDAGGEVFQISSSFTNKKEDTLSDINLNLEKLSISSIPYGELQVDDNGLLKIYQDGAEIVVGQTAVAKFLNNVELDALGGNLYKSTGPQGSGNAIFATGNANMASVSSKSLELSNADLSESLVNLIVYQRAFEANSKLITTSDEILNKLLEMKR
jgi:flagellar hook protein FlgE